MSYGLQMTMEKLFFFSKEEVLRGDEEDAKNRY